MDSVTDRYGPGAALYVVEIDRGLRIKVGYTTDPAKRVALLRSTALAHGCKPGRKWTSLPGSGTAARERDLITFCAARARTRHRSEYFSGLDFAVVVRYAKGLCGEGPTMTASRRRSTGVVDRDAAFERAVQCTTGGSRVHGTTAEAARWLGMPESAVDALVAAGALRTIKFGRDRRIPVSSMREWLGGALPSS